MSCFKKEFLPLTKLHTLQFKNIFRVLSRLYNRLQICHRFWAINDLYWISSLKNQLVTVFSNQLFILILKYVVCGMWFSEKQKKNLDRITAVLNLKLWFFLTEFCYKRYHVWIALHSAPKVCTHPFEQQK